MAKAKGKVWEATWSPGERVKTSLVIGRNLLAALKTQAYRERTDVSALLARLGATYLGRKGVLR